MEPEESNKSETTDEAPPPATGDEDKFEVVRLPLGAAEPKRPEGLAHTIPWGKGRDLYNGMRQVDVDACEEDMGEVVRLTERVVRDLLRMGELLIDAQARFARAGRDGKFTAYLRDRVCMSRTRAYALMEAYRRFSNRPDIGTISPNVLYLLAQTTKEDADRVLEQIALGTVENTPTAVKKTIRKGTRKAKPKAPDPAITPLEPKVGADQDQQTQPAAAGVAEVPVGPVDVPGVMPEPIVEPTVEPSAGAGAAGLEPELTGQDHQAQPVTPGTTSASVNPIHLPGVTPEVEQESNRPLVGGDIDAGDTADNKQDDAEDAENGEWDEEETLTPEQQAQLDADEATEEWQETYVSEHGGTHGQLAHRVQAFIHLGFDDAPWRWIATPDHLADLLPIWEEYQQRSWAMHHIPQMRGHAKFDASHGVTGEAVVAATQQYAQFYERQFLEHVADTRQALHGYLALLDQVEEAAHRIYQPPADLPEPEPDTPAPAAESMSSTPETTAPPEPPTKPKRGWARERIRTYYREHPDALTGRTVRAVGEELGVDFTVVSDVRRELRAEAAPAEESTHGD